MYHTEGGAYIAQKNTKDDRKVVLLVVVLLSDCCFLELMELEQFFRLFKHKLPLFIRGGSHFNVVSLCSFCYKAQKLKSLV